MSIRCAREKQYNLDDQRRFSVTQVTYEMDLNNKSEKVIQKVKAKIIQNVPGVLKKTKLTKVQVQFEQDMYCVWNVTGKMEEKGDSDSK